MVIVVTKMREYITSHGDFRFIINKYYFGESSRSSLPGVPFNSYLDTTICDRWSQSLSIEYREIWNGKVVIVQRVRFVFVSHLTE